MLNDKQRLVSVVVPVYNEAEHVVPLLDRLSALELDHETLFVYDFDEDTTIPPARRYQASYPQLKLLRNGFGVGVLNALRAGLEAATGDVVVVTMADLSDDLGQLSRLVGLVREGAGVAAASRYADGGRQIGGPLAKRTLSRLAGRSLHLLAGVGTTDPTNNFKAYSRRFLDSVQIQSKLGFELALELTTKAHLAGLEIEEIPTIWRDRSEGSSRFRTIRWLPGYLRWYLVCLIGTWIGKRRRARRGSL